MHLKTPKVAAIHDLSGFGRTSLMVVIPILSTLGIQVCPLPTAVLSTHTSGFDDFRFVDLTSAMRDFLKHWQELNLRFDAVYSGFLGSASQVETVAECIETCLVQNGLAVVDPVLGDNGKLDPTMNMEIVQRMRWLVSKATCITPNLTEAALLLDEPYPFELIDQGLPTTMVKEWLERLTNMGPDIAVITSVPVPTNAKGLQSHGIHSAHDTKTNNTQLSMVAAHHKGEDRFWKVDCDYIPAFYPGTGDTFASVLTGSLLQGDSLPFAMDRAVQFVTHGIRAAFGHNTPHREGIFLERVLGSLQAPVPSTSYTLL